MRKKSGFSLIELLMVVAIIAVVSAVTIPGILSWRSGAKLRGAAGNLKGDVEMAKVNAIKHNNFVAVKFNGDAYEVFVDTSGDGARDAARHHDQEGRQNLPYCSSGAHGRVLEDPPQAGRA